VKTNLFLTATTAVMTKLSKEIIIMIISSKLAIGSAKRSKLYGPIDKVFFNYAKPKPTSNPNSYPE